MKTRITKLIAKTMAAVAVGLLASLQLAQAQTGDDSVRFVAYASVGIVHGQRLRTTVSNSEQSTGTLSLSFSYYIAHNSSAVYESEWMRVSQGEFRSSEIRRADLKTEGDPETALAQVIVKVTMVAPAGSEPEDFPAALEVIDDANQAEPPDSKYRLILVAAKRSKPLAPISFVDGERLSFTFINPNEEGSEPVRVVAYIYDAPGRLISQTQPVKLGPGESYTAIINRNDLPVPGEDMTGRLEVRASIQVVLLDGSVRPVKLAVSMERVDNRTGSSSGGDYFTGTVSVSGDGF